MKILAKEETMGHRNLRLATVIIGSLSLAGATALMPIHQTCAQPQQQVSYAEDVVPIFRGYCISCHQPGGEGFKASGFDLSTYQGLMKGTKFGPMVIPGQPDISNLVVLTEGRAAPQLRMPHDHKQLPSCLRQEIWTWIFQGAKEN